MKFGLGVECDRSFQKSIEQAVLAESLGYDSICIQEHHGVRGYVPSPLMALAAIAPRTSRVLLRTDVVVLPLYHPVQLAEHAAMVQFISGGRLVLGVGLGYVPEEFECMSVPFAQRAGRMEESLGLLERLWTETDLRHEGRYFTFAHATVFPRLDGVGLPPVFVGGWVEAAIRRAARLADGWVPGPTVDLDTLQKCFGVFRDELARTGRSAPVEYPATRELYCAPTRAEAVKIGGLPMYQFYKDTYLRWPHPYLREAERRMSYEELARDRFIIGDPDDCIEAIGKLRDMGVTHLSFRMQPPGVEWDDAEASMRLFVERVVPHFR